MVRIANTGGTGVVTDSISDPAGDRLGTKTGSTVAWLTPDLHGSIAAGLAQTPSVVTDAIRYDGYGQTVAVWPTGGSAATASWKYQGRLDLSPSSIPLYAAGARDYAPGLGMFTSLDTFAGSAQDPLSMNRFLYAEANPATLVDPSGHRAKRGGGSAKDYGPQPDTCTSYNCTGQGTGGSTDTGNGGPSPSTKRTAGTPHNVPDETAPWWELHGYKSPDDFFCGAFATGEFGAIPEACADHKTAIDESWNRTCATNPSQLGCLVPTLRPEPCDGLCFITAVELVSYVDPTGITNAILAVHYCWTGDDGNCAANALALIPLGGGIIKDIGKGTKLGIEASSRLLGASLESAGFVRLEGEAAHHIVAGRSLDAAAGRSVLDKFGIDVNSDVNGIFLPGNVGMPNPLDKAVHSTLHTDDYYAAVNELLRNAQGQDDVVLYLDYLRELLRTGQTPWR